MTLWSSEPFVAKCDPDVHAHLSGLIVLGGAWAQLEALPEGDKQLWLLGRAAVGGARCGVGLVFRCCHHDSILLSPGRSKRLLTASYIFPLSFPSIFLSPSPLQDVISGVQTHLQNALPDIRLRGMAVAEVLTGWLARPGEGKKLDFGLDADL